MVETAAYKILHKITFNSQENISAVSIGVKLYRRADVTIISKVRIIAKTVRYMWTIDT